MIYDISYLLGCFKDADCVTMIGKRTSVISLFYELYWNFPKNSNIGVQNEH